MARGVNKVMLIGNLGQDPEVKYMPNGNAVTNISVATSDNWKDKQTGERKERTEWHRVVFFGRLAEIAGEYLHKGSKVYHTGDSSLGNAVDLIPALYCLPRVRIEAFHAQANSPPLPVDVEHIVIVALA